MATTIFPSASRMYVGFEAATRHTARSLATVCVSVRLPWRHLIVGPRLLLLVLDPCRNLLLPSAHPAQPEKPARYAWAGLGEALQGNGLVDSQLDIKFKGGCSKRGRDAECRSSTSRVRSCSCAQTRRKAAVRLCLQAAIKGGGVWLLRPSLPSCAVL